MQRFPCQTVVVIPCCFTPSGKIHRVSLQQPADHKSENELLFPRPGMQWSHVVLLLLWEYLRLIYMYSTVHTVEPLNGGHSETSYWWLFLCHILESECLWPLKVIFGADMLFLLCPLFGVSFYQRLYCMYMYMLCANVLVNNVYHIRSRYYCTTITGRSIM